MVRLARKIHFNAGRHLWRADWPAEKNTAVYGTEGPHGYGHNYALEVAVEGEIDPETSMVVNLTDLDRILKEEVDAPLDETNIGRFTELVREMSSQTQFVLITHSKKTMSVAPVMYGVTMQEPGVSKLVSVRFGT